MEYALQQHHIELLGQWHDSHRRALVAEHLATRPEANIFGDGEALTVAAATLRASADEVFERLVQQEAFGSLSPMPEIKPR